MSEEARIEIHPQPAGLGPVNPSLEFSDPVITPFLFLATQFRIAGMEIETVLTRNQREGFLHILPEFLRSPGLTGIVTRSSKTATRQISSCIA